MSTQKFDWIRYKDQFIKVRQLPSGDYHAIVSPAMPDFPVREMLVAQTWDGTHQFTIDTSSPEAAVASANLKLNAAANYRKKGATVSIFKPTPAEQAKYAKQRANYPWPVKIVLALVEFALYIVLGSLAIAIIVAPIAAIVWLVGKLFGAW